MHPSGMAKMLLARSSKCRGRLSGDITIRTEINCAGVHPRLMNQKAAVSDMLVRRNVWN